MRVYRCDKCGELIGTIPNAKVTHSDYDRLDLCEKCFNSFLNWRQSDENNVVEYAKRISQVCRDHKQCFSCPFCIDEDCVLSRSVTDWEVLLRNV